MKLSFQFGNEIVIVNIADGNITFSTILTNFQQFYPIDAIRLDRAGILVEHPDLKDLPYDEMKRIAIKRLKEHIKNLGGENEIKDYVIKELTSKGYSLKGIERRGFRPAKIK